MFLRQNHYYSLRKGCVWNPILILNIFFHLPYSTLMGWIQNEIGEFVPLNAHFIFFLQRIFIWKIIDLRKNIDLSFI